MAKQHPHAALRRRLVPSAPLMLTLAEDGGSTVTHAFRLSFDFNALARVEELTGLNVLSGEIWAHLNPKTLGALFWGAILANHPEYNCEEGLEIVRSFMDAGNADQIAMAILDAFILSLPADKQAPMLKLKEMALHGGNPTSPGPATRETGSRLETAPLPDGSTITPSPATI
jgi:hypothetical protein